MAVLADCDQVIDLQPVEPSLTISAVMSGITVPSGDIRVPAMMATWVPPASQYVLGIQFEYVDAVGAAVQTQMQRKDKAIWQTSDGVVAGAVYQARYRACGLNGIYGDWSIYQAIQIPAQFVAGNTANVGNVPAADVAQFYIFERPQVLDDLADARDTIYAAGIGLVDRTSALFNQVNTPTTGIIARLATVETTQQTDNSAAVLRLQGLEASVNTPSTGLLARALQSEQAITSLQTGKASVERVGLLETRARSLPNLIEDGDFSQEPLGVNWFQEGGPNSSIGEDATIGRFLSLFDYVVSKPYPYAAGSKLSVSWDGNTASTAANVYLQALPSYALLARASNSPAQNNWETRKFSDPALSVPAPSGTTHFRVVFDPNGGLMNASRIKVNLGDQATFWSDELTTRSIGGSITTLETVTSDLQLNKASAQRVTQLEAGSDDVYLTQNTNFNVYTNAAQTGFTTPDFWNPWGEKVNDSHRVPGHIGPFAWWSHNNAGGGIGTGDVGITQSFNGNPRLSNLPAAVYVLEGDIWFGAGQIGGAGVLAYFDGGGDQMKIDFAVDKPVGRDTPLGYDYGTGGLLSFRKLVKPANVGNGNLIFHCMTEWDGFEGGARPKVIEWQRCGIRLATPQEVAAERADATAGTALAKSITNEQVSAELTARGGGGGNLIGNAILANTVGWTVSLPNNAESTLDRANTGVNLPSDNNWHPAGENCLSTHVNAPDASWYMDWFSDTFTLEPGKTYEFGARAGVHRTQAQVYLQVSNIDGSQATYPQATLISNGQVTMTEVFQGGKDLSAYGHFWGKYTVPTSGGFTRGRLILRRFSTNAGQADSWSWWTRPYCREIPADQTRPSPWNAGVPSWNLRASWQQGTSVPGADTFISALSTLENGKATSSVAIGAQIFSVFNQIGGNWVKALEVVNGNAIFSGGLQAGAFIRLGNGNGWPVALKNVDFNLSDGEVVSFGTDLGSLPAVTFAQNNLAPLNAGETYDVRAINLTATGFTMSAKISIPAAPANQSVTGPGYSETVVYAGRTLFLESRPNAADNTYMLQVTGAQQHRIIPSGGGVIIADNEDYQTVELRLYAYTTSWQDIGPLFGTSISDPDNYPSSGGPNQPPITVTEQFTYYDTVTLPAGATHINVGRVGASNGMGGSVGAVGPMSWQAQGAGSSQRTATPNGQKTRATVRPQ